jgi:hypothetical protein
MIVAVEAIEASYRFLDRRYHFRGTLGLVGVRAALDDARRLATTEGDEPAALFFALASRPKSLGGAWRLLPALVALNHASRIGLRLRVNPRDFEPLYMPLVSRELTYEDVRAWFTERVERT